MAAQNQHSDLAEAGCPADPSSYLSFDMHKIQAIAFSRGARDNGHAKLKELTP